MDGRTVGRPVGLFALLALGSVALLARPSGRAADIHAEYVKLLSGKDTITAYIAYPERPQPAPAVIVIHEIFGLSDFIRQTTEQLAKDGFVRTREKPEVADSAWNAAIRFFRAQLKS